MLQPLVTRPPYGTAGGPALSESKLPSGDPAGKGVSLDPSIPGAATYAKPSQEGPREPSKKDESMYHVDNADDLLKDQGKIDEIDHSHASPSYNGLGDRPDNDYSKTKYPYRDKIPNRHNAEMVENVKQLWLLRTAHEVQVPLDGSARVATRVPGIEEGLNPKVKERSQACAVTLKRADIGNLRWIFSVNCGNGPKMVKLKATRKGVVKALTKMDVHFACSCPAWRWLGPEFHAKGEEYIDGKPRGTASTPNIKDPERINRVCKHVAAVMGQIRKWEVPARTRTAHEVFQHAVRREMQMKTE
jgi:hypothetical protein